MPAVAIRLERPTEEILPGMTVLKGGRFRVKADIGMQVKISLAWTGVSLMQPPGTGQS